MTNEEFFKNRLFHSVYRLKEGPKASYYFLCGDWELPNRLSIRHRRNEGLKGQQEWSADVEGRLDGCFTKNEKSVYKLTKPFKVHTSIYKSSSPLFMGFGTLGISGKDKGRMPDTRDLVILYSPTHEREYISIYRFVGCAYVEYIKPAFEYVSNLIKAEQLKADK